MNWARALKTFDADDGIGAIVMTGSEKAFAAGADIGMMATYTYMDVYKGDYITRNWETVRSIRKPIIAAVAGFALGGGCELAMMCDIIIAADTAKFGQPEIKLGVMPGAGGTQRLPRAVSKAKAMDLCLTARFHGCRRGRARRIGVTRCSRRILTRRSNRCRGDDRRVPAAGGHDGEGVGESRL
jgi:enoyl-CoA hydratase/carnithine racemase